MLDKLWPKTPSSSKPASSGEIQTLIEYQRQQLELAQLLNAKLDQLLASLAGQGVKLAPLVLPPPRPLTPSSTTNSVANSSAQMASSPTAPVRPLRVRTADDITYMSRAERQAQQIEAQATQPSTDRRQTTTLPPPSPSTAR